MMIAGLVIAKKEKNEDKIEIIKKPTTILKIGDSLVDSKVMIDIEGEVLKPGVYSMDSGLRVIDVLAVAGGLSLEADREWVEKNINKAEMVREGMKIYIVKKGEVIKEQLGGQVKSGGIVSLNNATKEELDTLPGIGPSIAERIMEYRAKNGGFRNIEEIKMVSGIGDKLYLKIMDKIGL